MPFGDTDRRQGGNQTIDTLEGFEAILWDMNLYACPVYFAFLSVFVNNLYCWLTFSLTCPYYLLVNFVTLFN